MKIPHCMGHQLDTHYAALPNYVGVKYKMWLGLVGKYPHRWKKVSEKPVATSWAP